MYQAIVTHGRAWFFVLMVFSLLQRSKAADDISKVTTLQKERLVLLQQVAELKDRAFRAGEIPFSQRAKAMHKALQAELDLCQSNAERIKVREKMLELAKADEELVARLKRAGEAGPWDLPTAAARRLKIEIALEKLKNN